jgi:hypothetical protein
VASALATGLAVTIGVGGAGATHAWLSASAAAPGATVRAGTLTLQINGASSATLGGWEAAPDTPQAKAFTITNTGDAPAGIAGSILAPAVALAPYATARLTKVANQAACAPGLGGAQGALSGYTIPAGFDTVPVGAAHWYCLEVGIAAGAPITVSGQSLTFVLIVNGTQSGD